MKRPTQFWPSRGRRAAFLSWACLLLALAAHGQSITTVAGGGTSSHEGLSATAVILSSVGGLATDREGDVYISESDANVIYRVSIADGSISRYAGNGGGTFSGDGGAATEASLKNPRGIVFDDAGNLFIADQGNGRIRRVDVATRIITTVAGSDYDPERIGIGDGGPATSAFIPQPAGIAWSNGNLYVSDVQYDFNTVRKIDRDGVITTVAGKGGPGGFSGDGGPATEAEFSFPLGLAVDASGNLIIADTENHVVRRVDAATQIVTTIVGGGSPADDIGNGGAGTDAKLAFPTALAFDGAGNLLIADAYNQRGMIRKYDPASKIITLVAGNGEYGGGDDGPALAAGIYGPFAIAIDRRQNIFVHDGANNSIRRIDATTRIITRIAGGGSFIGDGRVGPAAFLSGPLGLAVDAAGNLIIADTGHSLVRKVDGRTGIISTIAGRTNNCCGGSEGRLATETSIGFPTDVAIGPDSRVYFTGPQDGVARLNADGTITVVAGGGQPADGVGDGGPATAAAMSAIGISFDQAGNLYIADHSYGNHHRVRKVNASTGVISTIAGSDAEGYSGDGGSATAAQLSAPRSVVVDRAGNVFISDGGNGAIRRIDAETGIITTYAGRGNPADGIGDGGPATDASISPLHMAIDGRNDDLYFADQNGHRVRKIDALTRVITTVAGRGTWYLDADFSGDNGPAKEAKLNFAYEMSGVAIDETGRIYVSDSKNHRVRMINACSSVDAPQLTEPAPGAITSTGPALSWQAVSGALRYDVYLDTVNPPVKTVAADLTATSFMPSNLQPGVQYFWRVSAKGDPFCAPIATATTAVSSFMTSGACAAGPFDASSPAPGAVTSTSVVALSWEPSTGAASYDVYIGTASPPPLVASGVTATTFNATVSSGSYSWFVVAHASCDANRTAATPIRTFQSTIPAGCTPGEIAVNLTSPTSGAIDESTSLELAWAASGSVTSFDLHFGTSQVPPLLVAGVTATRQRINTLSPGTTYYWRVVAHGPCDPAGVSSAVQSFTTRACAQPGEVTISFSPPPVPLGATYTLVWSVAAGLDPEGGYLVERSTSPSFNPVDSQMTSSTAASFVASSLGTYYHRVRAVSACDPATPGIVSEVKSVEVTAAKPNVVFTVVPAAVVASLGERIENRRGSFALENLGTAPLQVVVGRQELGSAPFFSVVDPTATDAAFVTLQPRQPKTFEIRYAGPPNDRSASYQGVIFVAATGAGLAVTPYAFVNLKMGGGSAVAPKFTADGFEVEYVAFSGFAGDDTARPPKIITITNPGSTPMDLAAEIGPEVWLIPEADWNATPLAPNESREIRLFTRRSRSPNGSPLPRYTYFTVRTKDGASARLLVQDNDQLPVATGRSTRLDLATRSFIVPEALSRASSGGALVTRLRLSNVGGEPVQVEIVFTPAGTDGFDPVAVRRTTVVLPPNDLLTLTDPLQQLFQLPRPASGSLEVRVPSARLGLVAVSASAIAIGANGGFVTPVVNRGEGARAGSAHVIAGIESQGSTTTSLTLAETSGVDAARVRVAIYDAAGVLRGETSSVMGRYGSTRFDNVGALINNASLQAGRIDVSVESGGGSVVGVAVVGSTDGGATLVSTPYAGSSAVSAVARAYSDTTPSGGTSSSTTTVIPLLASPVSSGASPSFLTSVGFQAFPGIAGSFAATYRSSSGSASTTRTISVPAGAMQMYRDIGAELFGVTGAAGSISVQTQTGKVHAVLQSAGSGGASSPSSSLPVPTTVSEALTTAAGGGQRTLFYDGLEQSVDSSRGSRWMLVLNEVSGNGGALNVRLYEAGNRSSAIAEKNFLIGPFQQLQLDTVFAALDLESADRKKDRTNVQVVVTAIGGTARVAAMAVSVDNRSGDTKTFPLVPSVGSATPSINLVTAILPPTTTPARRRAVRP